MERLIFNVTRDEANLILVALQELPYKLSAGLLNNLIKQADEQQARDAGTMAVSSTRDIT